MNCGVLKVSVATRIREVESAAQQYAFVQNLIKVDETRYSVKYRLHIDADLFVQLYFNERSGTVGMTLIDRGQRLYGRDRYAGQWHRHSTVSPHNHDNSLEGRKSVNVSEFLAEVQDILITAGLI